MFRRLLGRALLGDNLVGDSDSGTITTVLPTVAVVFINAPIIATVTTAAPNGYVPASYIHPGSGALPVIGWTAQNADTRPAFPPYTPTGVTPDWTSDVNPIGAGAYDQNQVMTGNMAPNPLNRGPIGDSTFGGMEGQPPNPNAPDEDVGSPEDLEY